MDIMRYRNAIDQLEINPELFVERYIKGIGERQRIRIIPSKAIFRFAATICFIVLLATTLKITLYEDRYAVTVIAAGIEVTPDVPFYIYQQSSVHYGEMLPDVGVGTILFDFNITIEGDDIESIIYSLGSETISRNNRYDFPAWFTENLEFDSFQIHPNEDNPNAYEGYYDYDTEVHYVTSMIGESYFVNDVNQSDKPYGLAVKINNNNGSWESEAFQLYITVIMDNGDKIEKVLKVSPMTTVFENSIPKLEMTIE